MKLKIKDTIKKQELKRRIDTNVANHMPINSENNHWTQQYPKIGSLLELWTWREDRKKREFLLISSALQRKPNCKIMLIFTNERVYFVRSVIVKFLICWWLAHENSIIIVKITFLSNVPHERCCVYFFFLFCLETRSSINLFEMIAVQINHIIYRYWDFWIANTATEINIAIN